MDIISLFSGGGGLDLGFLQEGFNIVYASDIDKHAVATYKFNIGNHIQLQDIEALDKSRLPKVEGVIGGPPCQSFSLAGKRDVQDPRSKLVWSYLEVIESVKPKFFIFENVVGLKSAKNNNGGLILEDLIYAFKNIGYKISWEILNAADFGVPQRRRRLFIVGTLPEYDFQFPLPTHSENANLLTKPWVSVEEALCDLPFATKDEVVNYLTEPVSEYQEYIRKGNTKGYVTEHSIPQMSELDKMIIDSVPVGGNYQDVPDYVPSKRIQNLKKTGGRTTCYGRLRPNMPSYTINTHFNRPNVGCNIHYREKRLITVREAMRLQSFPDWYLLKSKTKRGKHTIVGNAVPPLLAQVLAKEIKKTLKR